MPRPRIYKTNAERQAAYRERKAKAESPTESGTEAVTRRVMASQKKHEAVLERLSR